MIIPSGMELGASETGQPMLRRKMTSAERAGQRELQDYWHARRTETDEQRAARDAGAMAAITTAKTPGERVLAMARTGNPALRLQSEVDALDRALVVADRMGPKPSAEDNRLANLAELKARREAAVDRLAALGGGAA